MNNMINSLKEYVSEEFINKIKKVIKFILIYTVCFFILIISFKYAIPFVIALIIAIIIKPIKNMFLNYFKKYPRLKIGNSLISLLLTLTIVSMVLLILVGVLYVIIVQSEKFLMYITNPNTIDEVMAVTEKITTSLLNSIKKVDPNLRIKIKEIINQMVSLISNVVNVLGKKLLSFAVSIPTVIISVFITLISTYFFIKDIEKIQQKVKRIFSAKGLEVIHNIKQKMNKVTGGYVKAYVIIMLTVALISFIVYKIAKVQYALPIALLTAVLDLLPIIGAGLVYGVLIISMYLSEKTLSAIIILIGYFIIVVIRQILEQNLVASFIGVHPLIMIIALFIALTPLGFIGTLYFIGAIIIFEMI